MVDATQPMDIVAVLQGADTTDQLPPHYEGVANHRHRTVRARLRFCHAGGPCGVADAMAGRA